MAAAGITAPRLRARAGEVRPADAPTPVHAATSPGAPTAGTSHELPRRSFMLNEEALRNFGGDQLKKTHDVAIAVIEAYYGRRRTDVLSGNVAGRSRGNESSSAGRTITTARSSSTRPICSRPATVRQPRSKALYAENAWLDRRGRRTLNGAVSRPANARWGKGRDGHQHRRLRRRLRCAQDSPLRGRGAGARHLPRRRAISGCPRRHEYANRDAAAAGRRPRLRGLADHVANLDRARGEWAPRPNPLCHPRPSRTSGWPSSPIPAIRFGILQDPDANSLEFDVAGHESPHHRTLRDHRRRLGRHAPLRRGAAVRSCCFTAPSDFAIPFGNTVDWYERVVAEMGEAETSRLHALLARRRGPGHGSGVFPTLAGTPLDALEAWVEDGTPPEVVCWLPMQRRRRLGGRGPSANTRPMRS